VLGSRELIAIYPYWFLCGSSSFFQKAYIMTMDTDRIAGSAKNVAGKVESADED
jgi:hypothetical protein